MNVGSGLPDAGAVVFSRALSTPIRTTSTRWWRSTVPPVQVDGYANCQCDACGEGVLGDCSRRHGGQTLCIPCFEQAIAA